MRECYARAGPSSSAKIAMQPCKTVATHPTDPGALSTCRHTRRLKGTHMQDNKALLIVVALLAAAVLYGLLLIT